MNRLNDLLHELGISKVKLAKYLGVSRQMVYNYLDNDDISEWPKEKRIKLMELLSISDLSDIENLILNSEYFKMVENKLNEAEKNEATFLCGSLEVKGLNKKNQELLISVFNYIKDILVDCDDDDQQALMIKYLFDFLKSSESVKEMKYVLAFFSKLNGYCSPYEFAFNQKEQFRLESILYSAMTLYNSNEASEPKIADSHKRFVRDIEQKKEEILSITQEMYTARDQALKELGFTEINQKNAAMVLEKIAEIQSRKVS